VDGRWPARQSPRGGTTRAPASPAAWATCRKRRAWPSPHRRVARIGCWCWTMQGAVSLRPGAC